MGIEITRMVDQVKWPSQCVLQFVIDSVLKFKIAFVNKILLWLEKGHS